VATEHVPDFTSKKQGTVFIVHGKSGRQISAYSRTPYDMEVLFPPRCRFRVSAWYRGDVICLGQANIRQHTFGIKPEDLAKYAGGNAALIIELTEM
jgi:hypothetical protein